MKFHLSSVLVGILGLSLVLAWGCGPAEGPQTLEGDSPSVTTGKASALGTRAFSPNGTIHPQGRPTTYFFEYGPDPEYGRRTRERPLPPRLAAYYNETWDSGLGGWASWLENKHFAAGGVSGGYVSFSEPSRHDHNHDDGIGTLHLTKYLLCGRCKPSEGPCLAAGDPDLRDAKVSISVRGHDWEPNGSELLWWSQSYIHIEMIDDPGYRAVNWAYTGHLLTDLLRDGEWHTAEYRLWNDTSYWSFGGNNPTKQGGVARRYDYGSIDLIQGHLNDDFFHLAAFIDTDNPPTGTIDFDEFKLVYRNESLVFPSNGGQLVQSPSDSSSDAAVLTDGWRHGEGHQWKSAQSPSEPQEFVYSFQRPVTIDSVQLHQNPLWPGREVEVLVSGDGEDYSSLFKQELPEKGEKGPNSAYTLDSRLGAPAKFLKLRILSGYRDRHWGLGEIEVFGAGAVMLPDDDLYRVNTDITGLTPGTTYHYRLVARSEGGLTPGDDQQFAVPATNQPLAKTGKATRVGSTSAKVEGRLNPMGARTQFHFEYGTGKSYGSKTPSSYGGLQITPLTGFAQLKELKPATTYHYRMVSVSEKGTTYGEDATFQTLDAP